MYVLVATYVYSTYIKTKCTYTATMQKGKRLASYTSKQYAAMANAMITCYNYCHHLLHWLTEVCLADLKGNNHSKL